MTHTMDDMRVWTTLEPRQGSGILYVRGPVAAAGTSLVRCLVEREGNTISEERFSPADFQEGVSLRDLQVRYWWPNGAGDQPLYQLRVELRDAGGRELDGAVRRVGFRHVMWGMAEDAAPSLCVMNDRPIGLNVQPWSPGQSLDDYLDQGVNTVRVEGEEEADFYAMCDALGLMVWQDLPADPAAAGRLIGRLQHHVSLLLWSGQGPGLEAVVSTLDPTRRFVPTA